MIAADLARVVHTSRSFRRSGQLMPSTGNGRSRVPALDLAMRLRMERGLSCTEPEVFVMLETLQRLGCVDRGDGGWAVCDWDRLGQVGATSTITVRPARKAKR